MPPCKLRDNLYHCHRLKMSWHFFAYDLCDSLNQMSWTSKIRWADVGTQACKVQNACTFVNPNCHNLLNETHINISKPRATYSMNHVAMRVGRVWEVELRLSRHFYDLAALAPQDAEAYVRMREQALSEQNRIWGSKRINLLSTILGIHTSKCSIILGKV